MNPVVHDADELGAIITGTVTCGTILELHNNTAHLEPASYQARLSAAKETTSLINYLTDEDYEQGCVVFGVRLLLNANSFD
jgi:hypothetical protein